MDNWTSTFEEDYQVSLEDEQQTRRNIKLIFCIIYAILFILGTLGNGFVIVMICNVMSVISRNRVKVIRKISVSSTKHVFIYVLALSIVDLFVILHLPLLICEMIEGQWIFGQLMCKIYWFGESVNKLLSSFLMTVLSWDRFLAVCSPIKCFRMRSNSVALTVVLSISLLATLLLYPVLKESAVVKVNRMTGLRLSENSLDLQQSDEVGLTIKKCIFDTPTSFFMLYTFIIGYIVPALLIIFFYLKVILRLRSNALSVRKYSDSHTSQISNARFYKVTKRIVAVVLFYFLCWSPYWLLNIMSQFGVFVVSWSTLTLSSVFFSAHLLVCFNSAANPVLYALINRELRQQHVQAMQKRRQSFHVATQNAMEFVEKHSQILQTSSPTPFKNKHRLFVFVDTKKLTLRSVSSADNCRFSFPHLPTISKLGSTNKRSSSFCHYSSEKKGENNVSKNNNVLNEYPSPPVSECASPSAHNGCTIFRFRSVLSLLSINSKQTNVATPKQKDSIDSMILMKKNSVRFANLAKPKTKNDEQEEAKINKNIDKLSQNFDFFL